MAMDLNTQTGKLKCNLCELELTGLQWCARRC